MTELRNLCIKEIVNNSPLAILDDDKSIAYLLSADDYESLLNQLENVELANIVRERQGGKTVKVSLKNL